MPATIILVDDHPIFRQGLRHLLAKEKNLSIVGEAGDGRTAIDLVRRENPDIVVMDVSMPDIDGIEATRQILSELPATKIVALSMHSNKQFIEGMIQAGASGYILKESVPEEMIQGIRTVLAGEVYLSASISGIVISEYKKLLSATVPAAETLTGPILRTKLQRLPLSSDIIPRPRLIEQLEKGRQGMMTLVSAPAGYGKSIAVSQWLETCGYPAAWVSLDKTDSDLRLFLKYFVTAIQTISPDAVRKTMAMLDSFQLPPLSIVAVSLINELDRIEQPFILCLDDCHLIRNESVFELLAELLKNPPQSMHLILTSRRDLPLPFHMLRAQSRMTEIRTQELRFNLEETTTFLNKTLGIEVDPATSRALGEKTEGWVTGLRLAALTLKLKGNIDPRLLEPMVNAQYVMEYLFNEVFSHQPPEFSRYLLGTSILERFCAPLCDAVCLPGEDPLTCEAGGWKFLTWLKEENVFVNFLDSENRWFRYHHIFRKFLGNQLKRHYRTDEIKTLHASASGWFFDNNLFEEGIRHSLAADNIPGAAEMVVKHGQTLMDDEQWSRLERWLGMLPRDTIEQDPELIMLEAWHNHVHKAGHDLSAMGTYLEKVKMLLDNLPEKNSLHAAQIRGHFDALCGFQSLIFGDAENAQKYIQSACKNIPMHHKRARVLARIFQAGAYQMTGNLETGLPVYVDELQKSLKVDSAYHAMYLVNLCFIYWLEADLFTMRKNAERSLKIAMKHQMPEATALGLYFLGIACYLQNDLKTAEEQLSTLVNDYYFINTVMYAHGSVALALVYLAKGEIGRAQRLSEKVMDYAIDTNNNEAYLIVQAFEAEYALRQGNLAEASNWANQFNAKPFLLPFLFFLPQLTLAKIRMAQNTKDSRQQATDLLEQLSDYLTSIHNKSSQVSVIALQALQLDSQGEESVALERLTAALNLAEPGGCIRLFVDLGPQMADLLKQLIKQNVAVEYIGRILDAFKQDEHRAVLDASDPDGPSSHNRFSSSSSNSAFPLGRRPLWPLRAGGRIPNSDLHTSQPLVEPLTNRELEILDLLAQRFQNKEIAEKLFISPETVKKHLNNIYGKLSVNNRRQAVEQARDLGILSPHKD